MLGNNSNVIQTMLNTVQIHTDNETTFRCSASLCWDDTHEIYTCTQLHSIVTWLKNKADTLFQCLSVDHMFHVFGVDESLGATPAQFEKLCPALIEQKMSGSCQKKKTEHKKATMAQSINDLWNALLSTIIK